jgi:carboxypeptidase family protein
MRRLIYLSSLTLLLCVISSGNSPQSQGVAQATGSITGRVTVAGKPARNVSVMLSKSEKTLPNAQRMGLAAEVAAKSATDEEGRYQFTDLTAGAYTVSAFAPAMVQPEESSLQRIQRLLGDGGTQVSLTEGERVEGVDFDLRLGGVITGRVTDAGGKPVIAASIQVSRINAKAESGDIADIESNGSVFSIPFMDQFSTDDRGVYRVYGLEPGKYTVAVSRTAGLMALLSGGGGDTKKTYYPGVVDSSKATAVEVTPGTETGKIDIRLGLPSKTFRATGRVIEEETGKPVPNVAVSCSRIRRTSPDLPDSPAVAGVSFDLGEEGFALSDVRMPTLTDARGEFRIDGLASGAYRAVVLSIPGLKSGGGDTYSAPTKFEIKEADMPGIEIKMRKGATINGQLVVDGATDPAVSEKLGKLRINAFIEPSGSGWAPGPSSSPIAPDGTFRLEGLPPGKAHLSLSPSIDLNDWSARNEFQIVRIEHSGAVEDRTISITGSETITGVRVVIGLANCVLRGQVRIEGGSLPKSVALFATALGTRQQELDASGFAPVGPDGQFEITGLLPGEYEVFVRAGTPGHGEAPPTITSTRQRVSVGIGSPTEITLVVDLSAKDK